MISMETHTSNSHPSMPTFSLQECLCACKNENTWCMIEVIKLVEPLWHSKAAAYIVQQKLNGRFPFVFPLTLCKGGVMRSVRHLNTHVVSTGLLSNWSSQIIIYIASISWSLWTWLFDSIAMTMIFNPTTILYKESLQNMSKLCH